MKNLKYIDKIKIKRDQNGVPRIEAESFTDLSFGLGYCHARDRGLQMIFMRILGQGRGSEIMDSTEELLNVDLFFRRMNWNSRLATEVDNLTDKARKMCEAYTAGVNTRFKKKYPWEFRLMGYKPELWEIEDCILLSRMTGYLTMAQSQGEVERLLIEMVQEGISKEKLEELFPNKLDDLDYDLISKLQIPKMIVPDYLKWGSAAPMLSASNNWVVSGKHTKSGKPILANDPHLEGNRLPNVWYEAVLRTPDRYSIASTIPGLPGTLVGRTNHLSWGATYTFMDAIDSWVEKVEDSKYYREKDISWSAFNKRKEIIKRKGKPDYDATFYENELGTLEGDPIENGHYLITQWSSSHCGARSLNSMADMWEAETVEEGMDILGNIELSFNWVLADYAGNIGYQMSGLMPNRKDDTSGLVPLEGWVEKNHWNGFADPKELPRVINPDVGFIATANNDLNHLGKKFPINVSMGDYRARRIENSIQKLIDNGEKITVDHMKKLQLDTYSLQAEKFLDVILPGLPDNSEVKKTLSAWDCCYNSHSKAASIFEKLYTQLFASVFGKNENDYLGEKVIGHLLSETGIFVDFYACFDQVLLAEKSNWFNGKSRDELVREIAEKLEAIGLSEFEYNNSFVMKHILLGDKLPGFTGFNSKPVPIQGGRATVSQGQVYRNAGRETSFVPSFRMVTDLGDHFSHTCILGGPSDRRFSKWYKSEIDSWINGIYKKIYPDF